MVVHRHTKRGLAKFFFLSLITLGIYGIVVMSHISDEINRVARYDGQHTTHYCLIYFLLSPLTLGIVSLVWYTRLCSRIGYELERRDINYSFGAGIFWGWHVFGSLILVGPFIFIHKLMKAMNYLNMDYNERGE